MNLKEFDDIIKLNDQEYLKLLESKENVNGNLIIHTKSIFKIMYDDFLECLSNTIINIFNEVNKSEKDNLFCIGVEKDSDNLMFYYRESLLCEVTFKIGTIMFQDMLYNLTNIINKNNKSRKLFFLYDDLNKPILLFITEHTKYKT